ncbi:hypothetical protein HS1genome_1998 [Sulfodiicoccus acidiphilus]|uniref:HTH bat-type domain-containing protein n=1 Tax=Sulfodiicoccus acidiphilus TaxID=1670455 RepID=A0A348B607_9CREN|nr:hypothetical protein HS1genome_1998 [Sulfodiicoccus acidiphilus]
MELKHRGCWGYRAPEGYADVLLNVKERRGTIAARRLAKTKGEGIYRLVKLLRSSDYITSSDVLKVDSSTYLVEMTVLPEFTVVMEFIDLEGVLDMTALLNGGVEVYNFVSDGISGDQIIRRLRERPDVSILRLSRFPADRNSIYRKRLEGVVSLLLTPHEREIIRSAKLMGYFDLPRKVGLESLADEYDTSKMAISITIRRAIKKLLDVI